uniref:argininosuccinate synthase n=1 Tax=Amorphochlora amoebiformis TaxID=1561963 RepID=A0A7S0DTX6_9EUKA|mmetsp:Transcript_8952/g.14132  ORF Transcript_8952/g.14132 Transcript_8952/m.14132 type:complete len:445 (+) Transcript_8952:87-1421(+)
MMVLKVIRSSGRIRSKGVRMASSLSVGELKGETVGVCVSGGLDSRTVTSRLKDAGATVMGFCADLDQPDEENIMDVKDKMAPCGVETFIVDLKEDMANIAFEVIKSQARYDGGYWNTTGMARAVTVRGLLGEMERQGCTVLSHGATGRGNDQIRFERYTNVLNPGMKVYAPWRDATLIEQFPGRRQMADYLLSKGIEAEVGAKKRYSTDANLAGLSHEAEDLEYLTTSSRIVTPTMTCWPEDAPDSIEKCSVVFEKGLCVAINGKDVDPLSAMRLANEIGGRNALGMANAMENRVIGTKSRGVYEAPGMDLLGYCLSQVYQTVLDKRSTELFLQMSRFVANQIYDGRYFDPSTRAALAAIDVLASRASGVVDVSLYKGTVFIDSISQVPHSIYVEEFASMEADEADQDGLNPTSAQGFVEVQKCEALALAKAGHIQARRKIIED